MPEVLTVLGKKRTSQKFTIFNIMENLGIEAMLIVISILIIVIEDHFFPKNLIVRKKSFD